jgi:hypothetical protein
MGKYVRSWSLDKIYPSVESKEFKIDLIKQITNRCIN